MFIEYSTQTILLEKNTKTVNSMKAQSMYKLNLTLGLLKPNACNNKARRIELHRYLWQFLPRDRGGFGHKNQKMFDF